MTKDKLLKTLKELEWSAYAESAPMYMGGEGMDVFPACPHCYGVKPSKAAKLEFREVGHTVDCILARCLEKK